MPENRPGSAPPTAFISYSWDDQPHKKWVRDLAARLRGDGVDVTLDQWALQPGDRLPTFMEAAIREHDFVIIVCTPHYRERSDARTGGVGYEGDIMTGQLLSQRNERKFIPVLRCGDASEAVPTWLTGKYHVDLRESADAERSYRDLLTTLLGQREAAPPLGPPSATGAIWSELPAPGRGAPVAEPVAELSSETVAEPEPLVGEAESPVAETEPPAGEPVASREGGSIDEAEMRRRIEVTRARVKATALDARMSPKGGSADEAEMRRRIEETRARVKAKAFDAMMTGEKPVPTADGIELDGELSDAPPQDEPIRILGVVVDEVSEPRMDGTGGSALYRVPLRLSRRPSAEWAELFERTWDHPPQFTTMHRPGIVAVQGDRVILDGTTMEEVERYHRDTLLLVLGKVNREIAEREDLRRRRAETERQRREEHCRSVEDAAKKMRFHE